MRRRLVLAALLATAAAAPSAAAQASPYGQLSFGLYGGLGSGGTWFHANDEDFGVGWGPLVGAVGEMRLSETVGVRGNLSYMHTRLPESDDIELGDERRINLFAYDVGLSWRPLARDPMPTLASAYAFAGVGGVTTDVHGFEESECMPVVVYLANGVCVPGGRTSKLQVNVGVGADAARLTENVTVFGEAAIHRFSSPARVCEDCGSGPEDRTAWMPRLVVGVRFQAP
jgi:hypothetical protein